MAPTPSHARPWRRHGAPALLAACAILAAGCAQPPRAPDAGAAKAAVASGPVSVTFTDPAGFDKERNGPGETEKTHLAWVNALGQYLAEQAAPRLPAGQRLEVRITDVQRAGGFEPWRTRTDVRIVRDVYPPRIDLEFKRLAADGSTLQSGTRKLRDNTFLMRPDMHPNDPLRFEKALLDDWLRKELPDAPARPRR